MSVTKRKILIVDDSPDDIHFLMENLKDTYAVVAATNGIKALEVANIEPRPDVVLMDVTMPEMDGYETCKRMRADLETKDIDVIFVSSHDTVEEKLAGYEAGGSDYLIKPIVPQELIQKVELSIANAHARNELKDEKNMAMETAMTAMSSTGELGVALEFLRTSFSVREIDRLGELIIQSMNNYALDCSVQLAAPFGLFYYGTQGPVSPLEQELLGRLKDAGRILEHGKRLILNFGDVSMVVKNMPEDDEKRGRHRDNLAILLEGAASKLHSLVLERQAAATSSGLKSLITVSNESLKKFKQKQQEQKEVSIKIMDTVMSQLEDSFLSWGLTEEQEEILTNVVQSGIEKALDNLDKGREIDDQLDKIINGLQKYISS